MYHVFWNYRRNKYLILDRVSKDEIYYHNLLFVEDDVVAGNMDFFIDDTYQNEYGDVEEFVVDTKQHDYEKFPTIKEAHRWIIEMVLID